MSHLTFLSLEGKHQAKMPSLHKLTLPQLLRLANLHTLKLCGFSKPDLDWQQLQPLRRLALCACHTDVFDLTSCTHLTSLTIVWDSGQPQHTGLLKPWRVLLPTGSNVQLQHLNIAARCLCMNFEELRNLQDATQLTSMQFSNTHPDNLDERGWPMFMPHLIAYRASNSPDWPPQQLATYPQLCSLEIHVPHAHRPPPAWMESQLKHLDLYSCTWKVMYPESDSDSHFE